MPKSDPVHVTLTASHTYRTGPSTMRTLPAGWSGYVDADVAKKIKAAKVGAPTPAADTPYDGKSSSDETKATSGKGAETDGQGSDTGSASGGTDTVAAPSGTDTVAGGNA